MRRNQPFWKLGLVLALIFACLSLQVFAAAEAPPKYIFMFIGDGMGIAQRQVAELQLNNTPGKTAIDQKKRLVMNTLRVNCVNTTYDSTSIVPDSASTATSLSSGYKTLSGVIGLREDKTTVTPYISEALKNKGYAVGIVSSVKIVHATPAAYYCHIDSRNKYDEIAEQLINSKFDLFVGGGGVKHFSPASRKDKRDLYQEAAAKGFTVATTSKEFLAAKPGQRVLANLPGDMNDEALPYALDRGPDDLPLPQIVKKSIDLLSANKKGFFLMVEEGKVDWACHANDTGSTIANMLDLDQAVAAALEFKKKHPQTLIIVTGDHECGGLGLSMGTEYRVNPELFYNQKLSFEMADVKVAAILKNERDPQSGILKLAADFGLTHPTESEKAQIAKALADEQAGLSKQQLNALYGGYRPVSMTFCRLMNTRANLFWTSYVHTGIPVLTTVEGVGAARFSGYKDNTDICKALNQVAQAGLKW
ncbi:alkaline phosphatase [Hydrogenispora ethanolica]|uniref:Alkaline phosphatase n=1 Tax=Hydrogenispora ethanolica TaxID=1082276 RepID=A0A4R1S7B8_HYDET|nr:alkaline phosphatase [Hydrogenispora ethanolica]TCL75293.1 alkaline phosphatase [Hydrogenispora ethanolica]